MSTEAVTITHLEFGEWCTCPGGIDLLTILVPHAQAGDVLFGHRNDSPLEGLVEAVPRVGAPDRTVDCDAWGRNRRNWLAGMRKTKDDAIDDLAGDANVVFGDIEQGVAGSVNNVLSRGKRQY